MDMYFASQLNLATTFYFLLLKLLSFNQYRCKTLNRPHVRDALCIINIREKNESLYDYFFFCIVLSFKEHLLNNAEYAGQLLNKFILNLASCMYQLIIPMNQVMSLLLIIRQISFPTIRQQLVESTFSKISQRSQYESQNG